MVLMEFKIKNRHRLKSKNIRSLKKQIEEIYGTLFFDENSIVETGEFENIKFIFIDNVVCFFYQNNILFFTLKGVEKLKPKEKKVTVDMGAVKFVTSGADVMAPGITNADSDILEDMPVWICDETHNKALAVGLSLMTGEEMIAQNKGKAINVIHYVGDDIWNFVNQQ